MNLSLRRHFPSTCIGHGQPFSWVAHYYQNRKLSWVFSTKGYPFWQNDAELTKRSHNDCTGSEDAGGKATHVKESELALAIANA